jgi:hypothetical protein
MMTEVRLILRTRDHFGNNHQLILGYNGTPMEVDEALFGENSPMEIKHYSENKITRLSKSEVLAVELVKVEEPEKPDRTIRSEDKEG